MKVVLIGKDKIIWRKGASILEVLITTFILSLSISGAAMISFATQSTQLDSETSEEALYKAKDLLENTKATALENFPSIIENTTVDTIYTKKINVTDISPCLKEVVSKVTWNTEIPRPQKIELKSYVKDIKEAINLNGDCDTEIIIGGWTNPNSLVSTDITPSGNKATDISVLNKLVYMSAGTTGASNRPDFFILDATNIQNGVTPAILGSLDTGDGLNNLKVVKDSNSTNIYVYALQNKTTSQLQIIDTTNPASPTLINTINLPVNVLGVSIYYYQGKIYIGTNYIANVNSKEFYIYCISFSCGSSPTTPTLLGSYKVSHNINDIIVRGDYAYLATSDDRGELTILNISNPSAISLSSKFNAPGLNNNDEDGRNIYLIGNKIYLGKDRAPSNRKDFYILDITNPMSILELGSRNLGLHTNTTITGIRVNNKFAFLTTTDSNTSLLVFDISNPATLNTATPLSNFNFSQEATGIDLENGYIYTSNRTNDALRIISPAKCADKIDNDADNKIDSADSGCHSDNNANNISSYSIEDDNE